MVDLNLPIVLGLRELSPEQASALRLANRGISLPNTHEISDETIAAFVPDFFEGHLVLPNLYRMDSIAMARLIFPKNAGSSNTGTSSNNGIEQGVTKNLFQQPIDLSIGVMDAPSPEVADFFAKQSVSIIFTKLETIPLEMAKAFEIHSQTLLLPSVVRVSDDVAKSLARHPGPLSMTKLQELDSVELASKLADVNRETGVNLNRLRTITPEVATALVKTQGTISLTGLGSITSETRDILKTNKRVFFKVTHP